MLLQWSSSCFGNSKLSGLFPVLSWPPCLCFCVLPGLQPVTSLTSPRERARGLLAAWQYGRTRKARKLDVLIRQLAAQQKLPALMWSSPPRLPRLKTPRPINARTATRRNSNTQTTTDNSPYLQRCACCPLVDQAAPLGSSCCCYSRAEVVEVLNASSFLHPVLQHIPQEIFLLSMSCSFCCLSTPFSFCLLSHSSLSSSTSLLRPVWRCCFDWSWFCPFGRRRFSFWDSYLLFHLSPWPCSPDGFLMGLT